MGHMKKTQETKRKLKGDEEKKSGNPRRRSGKSKEKGKGNNKERRRRRLKGKNFGEAEYGRRTGEEKEEQSQGIRIRLVITQLVNTANTISITQHTQVHKHMKSYRTNATHRNKSKHCLIQTRNGIHK